MPVRFDDSLEKLVALLEGAAFSLDEATTIVRDGQGRLLVARAEVRDEEGLADRIREGLGAYAGPIPLVTGALAEELVKDSSVREIPVGDRWIRYADRRIVGADWLATPIEPPAGPPRLVFGSLKGGVGRSTALAVLAADLARDQLRVLVVDLDLEAPGIGFMLLRGEGEGSEDERPRYGAIDYLVENGLGGIADEDLVDFVGVSSFGEGGIHVLPAVGRVTDENPANMLAKLSRALTEDVGPNGRTTVVEQIRAMIERFASRSRYGAVLVDARAGLAEATAAALLGLGGEVLLFGIDEPQTFRAYRYLLAHLSRNFDPDVADWRRRITFVQAKAPASEAARRAFKDRLYELCAEHLYDREEIDETGSVQPADFHPAPDEEGPGVPHDALFVLNHPDYHAFDPIGDRSRLQPDVYDGPFGAFLGRARELLGLSRPTGDRVR